MKALGHNHFQAPKATIDHSLNNLSDLLTEIRAVPNMQAGHTDGFALSEVAPGSIFDQVGLQDGDILKAVNGQEVNDPSQAMQMRNLQRQHSRSTSG